MKRVQEPHGERQTPSCRTKRRTIPNSATTGGSMNSSSPLVGMASASANSASVSQDVKTDAVGHSDQGDVRRPPRSPMVDRASLHAAQWALLNGPFRDDARVYRNSLLPKHEAYPTGVRGAIGSLGLATSPLDQRRGLLCNGCMLPTPRNCKGAEVR